MFSPEGCFLEKAWSARGQGQVLQGLGQSGTSQLCMVGAGTRGGKRCRKQE